MKTIKCRVCGREIGSYGWNKHVEKHKREYCRKMGIPEEKRWSIAWEDVVICFNPKESRQKVLKPIKQKENNLNDW